MPETFSDLMVYRVTIIYSPCYEQNMVYEIYQEAVLLCFNELLMEYGEQSI